MCCDDVHRVSSTDVGFGRACDSITVYRYFGLCRQGCDTCSQHVPVLHRNLMLPSLRYVTKAPASFETLNAERTFIKFDTGKFT